MLAGARDQHSGAAWRHGRRTNGSPPLEGPQRIATQKIEAVLSKLDLKPGMVVADIGAGSGLFSRPLAKAVAPAGKVYAVDIQQDLLDHINQRNKEENIGNIQPSLGVYDDPSCPRVMLIWPLSTMCCTISSTARFT
jgi:protein-L-isoaspartate O-methyltransferase